MLISLFRILPPLVSRILFVYYLRHLLLLPTLVPVLQMVHTS